MTVGGKISLVLLGLAVSLLLVQLLYQQPKEAMHDPDHPFWTYVRTMVIVDKVLSYPTSLFLGEAITSILELILFFTFIVLNPFVIGYSIEYFCLGKRK